MSAAQLCPSSLLICQPEMPASAGCAHSSATVPLPAVARGAGAFTGATEIWKTSDALSSASVFASLSAAR